MSDRLDIVAAGVYNSCHVVEGILGVVDDGGGHGCGRLESSCGVRSEEVDDLDTGLQDLGGSGLVDERGRVGVDGEELDAVDGTALINSLANNVHDASESALADRDLDGSTGVDDLLPANETLGTVHGNSTDRVLTEVGSDLEHETAAMEVLDLEGIKNWGKGLCLELHIDDSTNDCLDGADRALGLSRVAADLNG